jgi:site-specific recombinase XerD
MTELIRSAGKRLLTDRQFQGLAVMPPELEWFANLPNDKTRRAYKCDIRDFSSFVGLTRPEDMRRVTRAHVIAWRDHLTRAAGLSGASIRRKISALSSLFAYLCEKNAVADNPVHGVKRPSAGCGEGKTPALGDAQARRLLEAPPTDTLKGLRDRAILATLLYHGLRREELCRLKLRDRQSRQGIPHLRIQGKGGRERYLPVHPKAARLIDAYLARAGHGHDPQGPLFRAVRRSTEKGGIVRPMSAQAIYDLVDCL